MPMRAAYSEFGRRPGKNRKGQHWLKFILNANKVTSALDIILSNKQYTVDSEIFARILFSRIALKDILVMRKICD